MSILAYMFNQINSTMKRILMYMAMALGVFASWSCDPQTEPAPEPEPDPKPALQSFEVNVDGVTETTVTYTVTPALLDKEYLAVVKTAASLEGLEDEAIVEAVFADVKAAAEAENTTFEAKMAKLAVKGVSDKVEIDGLAADTEYALVVFGVDPAKAWEYTTFPDVKEFKTNAVEVVEYTFDVTTTVENNTVSFKVVPSDNTVADNDSVVGTICNDKKVPVYTSYGGAICYASLAIDYYELGRETGKMAAQVLLGEKIPSEIEIKTLVPTSSYNKDLCDLLGIEIPE